MALGLYIFSFLKNVHLGGWWGAICVIVSGMLGISSSNRRVVMGGCAVSSFGLIAAAVAVVLDGISASVFQGLVACANTETGIYYGSEDALKEIKSCAKDYTHKPPTGGKPFSEYNLNATFVGWPGHYNYYFYNRHQDDYFYGNYNFYPFYYYYANFYGYGNMSYNSNIFDDDFFVSGPGHHYYYNNNPHHHRDDDYFKAQPVCICTDHSLCYDYTLAHGSDCGSILTTYTNDLVSSTSLLAVSFFFLMIYCVVAFSSACYSGDYKVAADGTRDEIQMTTLPNPDLASPGGSVQMHAQHGNVGGVRYTVPVMVQTTPPSSTPQRLQPSPRQPVVPQYVQLGSTDRPVYILQMYAPTPGQVAPSAAQVFLDAPQFITMNSDPHLYLSKESSFQTGG